MIEGIYVVPKDSALKSVADVDRDGIRVAVAQGSAYDLYLTRALEHAKLVRRPSGPECLDMFVADKLEAAAGVRQPIAAFAQSRPDMRLIPGRFMAIEQAMGAPKGREAGVAFLRAFIEEMKASGFVARELAASGQGEAGGGAAGGVRRPAPSARRPVFSGTLRRRIRLERPYLRNLAPGNPAPGDLVPGDSAHGSDL